MTMTMTMTIKQIAMYMYIIPSYHSINAFKYDRIEDRYVFILTLIISNISVSNNNIKYIYV